MTDGARDHAGTVNLRCLPCGTRAPILPATGGQRAAAYLRRLGWRRHPRLGWCCHSCAERLASGQLDADALMAALQREAAERLAAILDQS